MSCPSHGPCLPFVDDLDLCCLVSGSFPDPCLVEGVPIASERVDGAILAASELMWAATGRKFGKCTVTIRPCQQGNACDPCPDGGTLPFEGGFSYGFGGFPWYPQLSGGVWTNISCPSCIGQCGCEKLCEIDLPYPTCCVNEVSVDGIILDPTMYRVDDFRKLVRLDSTPSVSGDAPDCWPTCQDLSLPDTEDGTFSVTVTYGREVPELVKMATAELACQFLKSCVGAPCQLPQRIQSMTRQGVTVGFLDQMAFLERGRTGIYLVDLAINTFNPYRLLKQASVYSIDTPPKWRLTDTAGDCP